MLPADSTTPKQEWQSVLSAQCHSLHLARGGKLLLGKEQMSGRGPRPVAKNAPRRPSRLGTPAGADSRWPRGALLVRLRSMYQG